MTLAEVEVSGFLPAGRNQREGMHRMKRHRLVREEKDVIGFTCRRHAVASQDERHRRVSITFVTKNELDDDNLVGRAKTVLDALVEIGWLIDDKPRYVTTHIEQKRPGEDGIGTWIRVEDGDHL